MYAFSTQVLKRLDINGEKFYILPNGPVAFKADEITDAILSAAGQNEPDVSELATLYGKAALSEAMSELSHILEKREAGLVQERKVVVEPSGAQSGHAITLGIADDCNMACTYCYQGSNKPANRMSKEVALAAVDLLARQATNGRAAIYFYGGEPLLNWECVRATIEYATKVFGHKVRFWLMTNGVLLTAERIEYLAAVGASIALSVDGPPELHDRHRKFADGRETHAIVVSNLKQAVELGCDVTAEVTLTKQHISIWPEIMRYILQLGVKDITVNPLETEDPVQAFVGQDWRRLADTYEQVALAGEQLPSFLQRYLDRVTDGRREYYRCEAGQTKFFIAPDGRIFPCPGFYYLGAGEMEMGHIEQGIDTQQQERIMATHVDRVPACRECWARYFCGGPCIYKAAKDDGDLRSPAPSDCQRMQAMVEFAIRVRLQQVAGEESVSVTSAEMQHCN